MPQISSITVEYGRSVQPAPYENANAKIGVTLAFNPDTDEADFHTEVTSALNDIRQQVHGILGLEAPRPAVTRSKPKVEVKGDVPTPKKPEPKPEPKSEPETEVTKGDVTKAITGARERLVASGVSDYKSEIERVIKAYVLKDTPPFTYNDIPKHAWVDFVYDLNQLGR